MYKTAARDCYANNLGLNYIMEFPPVEKVITLASSTPDVTEVPSCNKTQLFYANPLFSTFKNETKTSFNVVGI